MYDGQKRENTRPGNIFGFSLASILPIQHLLLHFLRSNTFFPFSSSCLRTAHAISQSWVVSTFFILLQTGHSHSLPSPSLCTATTSRCPYPSPSKKKRYKITGFTTATWHYTITTETKAKAQK
jgi:hypothetical protein